MTKDEIQAAIDAIDKFIQSRNATIDFLPDKTNENLSEWVSHFVHNVNYRLSFNDWMKLEKVRAALQSALNTIRKDENIKASDEQVDSVNKREGGADMKEQFPVIEGLDDAFEYCLGRFYYGHGYKDDLNYNKIYIVLNAAREYISLQKCLSITPQVNAGAVDLEKLREDLARKLSAQLPCAYSDTVFYNLFDCITREFNITRKTK
jgi:hypothetical protein